MILEVGKWYNTKRNFLCVVDMIKQDGSVTVRSHLTGNYIDITKEQVEFFTEAEEPNTEPGVALMGEESKKSNESGEYDHLYKKYPNIVKGSIYKVQSIASNANHTEELHYVNVNGKKRAKIKKQKKTAKGATRCLITCQVDGCNNTRDIKIQDAFQVKTCDDCKNKKKKANLKKFLKRKNNGQ
jgi:hypothetical protein